MENTFISFLYPDEASRAAHIDGASDVRISEEVCDQLGLTDLVSLRNSSLCDYFTSDPAVIRYRQATLADMKRLPSLADTLSRVVPILCDITELRRLDRDNADSAAQSYLYSITEIELYVNCISVLADGLGEVRDELKAPAFINLADFIFKLTESEYYLDLNKQLKELSRHVNEVKSVTIGVNLDAEFRPTDAGVLSINPEPFKSGKMLDKILRLSFKNDAMTCIAPLAPVTGSRTENRREALISAFKGALDDVFRSSVRAWRSIVAAYVLDNTDFLLKLLPEIEFISRASELEARLIEKGDPLCTPEVCPASEKTFEAKNLYNPDVALQISEAVVCNDFAFDDSARIFVLTGPNRGGKSVITCAVGLAQAMTQLGLSVAAESARISVADGIFTHFPEGAEDTIDKGRLGEECARLRDIFEEVTEDSLILLDESLSSTGAYEASYIAAEILTGFAVVRARGIFSTHLHDLAAAIPDINRRASEENGVQIDTLVAGIEEGRRSFLITRAKPDGKSYARDIADRYGLSFEGIRRITKGEQ